MRFHPFRKGVYKKQVLRFAQEGHPARKASQPGIPSRRPDSGGGPVLFSVPDLGERMLGFSELNSSGIFQLVPFGLILCSTDLEFDLPVG